MHSSIVTCDCGTKIRVPENVASRTLRCPKCKAGLALAANATVLSATAISLGEEAICPICQTAAQAGEPCVNCPDCDQIHHRDCWGEIGGCGTYGCAQAPAALQSEGTTAVPVAAWGDTKKCPACGENIKSIALRCRYCGTNFDSVDPMSVTDLRHSALSSDRLESLKRNVVILLVLSVAGCLAPLTLLVGLVYLLPKRAQLAKCGPLFVIMGWTSIVLSGIYSLAMLAFFLIDA